MNKTSKNTSGHCTLEPIGTVNSDNNTFSLAIDTRFRKGLAHLEHFSHVLVFWWAHQHDNPEDRSRITTKLPYARNIEAGVFACRSEYRPNPIAMTVCPIITIDQQNGIVDLAYIDAFAGTPVLDLKPYIPVCDRIKNISVADWFKDWPDWYEDAADFFSNYAFGE